MPHFLRLLKCPKLPPARNATEKAHRFRTVGDKNWKSLWCAYAKVPLLARSQTPVATIVFASKKSILASNIRTAAKTAPMPPCVIVPITICPLNWEPFRRTKAWNRLLGMEEWEKRSEVSRTKWFARFYNRSDVNFENRKRDERNLQLSI